MEKSFCQLIINAAESHRDKVAMRIVGEETDGKYTYGEMLDQVRSIAFRLEKENINFGDRVALISENHPRWAVAYYGILFRGAVCVPVDPHGEIETVTNFIENSEAKMAFIGEEFVKDFQAIEERFGRKFPAVVLQNVESSNGFGSFDDWATTPRPADFDKKTPPAKMEDLAQLTYTSGTTGTPKGVPLTHSNIYHEAVGCQEVMNLSETEVVLSVLPLFHVFAQVVNLWVVASIGGSVYYVKELAPAELTKAFETKEITLLTGVPRLWYLFHKKIFDNVAQQSVVVRTLFDKLLKTNFYLRENFNVNLGRKFFGKVHDGFGGNLRTTISAGSRFDEKIARDYHALGFTMIQGYGLTETTGAISCTRFEDNVVGSVGKAINYSETKIGELNDEGAGEVLIRGKMVFGGYYQNPEATKEAFTEDGWFRSGDLGKFDERGNLHIVGRSKDVIVLPNGKNIHPEDLEVHYSKTPMVGEMCILGVKDETSNLAGAEKLVAVVVPDFEYMKRNSIANAREAIRHEFDDLGRELPEYQRVRETIVRAEPLPRTATRKVRRFEVAKEIADGKFASSDAPLVKKLEFTDADKQLMASPIGNQLTKLVRQNSEQAEAEAIHPAMSLEIDLGLDSLSRAEVFAGLEQAFGIEFDGDEAANALTVKEVVELTEKHTGGANAEIVETDFNWGKIVRESDDRMPEVQGILKSRTFGMALVYTVFKFFNLIARLFFRLEVSGKENLRAVKRPFIVAPNHQSYLDPFLVTSEYAFDDFKNSFAVGASQFFESKFMQSLAAFLNTVPIDADTQLLKAMKAGAVGLKHGKILNIFPEGARAFDGELHEFKKGAAILAVELDVPVVPVALDGFYRVWGRSSGKINFSKTQIRYGKPFLPREIISAEMTDEAQYAAVTAHLKSEIERMLGEMRSNQ
ncbi:MAG: Long-chain-fatty-acid--CoA ligase [uncultured Pyrinomonadaceae bacterium]|uniref:Long-chain-fatty-acid--CoA ligase n=1 Tax=uncultured Pyrinomonadaceae bacterium TaxID=2283094 RepID=A0A6J4Q1G3_9BACT|nr:MAG: Long-chain-fatty-acid--CoA ligase [uncultured Pyrinomonadaceae bacterium]